MAVGKISELVDDSAIAQLQALYEKLGITTQAMVAGTDAAAGYIAAIGKVNTIAEFNAANQQAVTVMGEVKQAQEKVVQSQQQIITASNQAAEAVRAKMAADADATAILTKLGGSITDNNLLLAQQKIQLDQVTAQLKEHAAAMGGDVNAQIRNIETTAKLTQQQFLFKEAVSQTTLTIKQQTKEELAAETSNTLLIAQLNQLIKLQNSLSAEERVSTASGRELQAQITATRNAVVTANEAQGKFNDNVGNYPGKAEPAIAAVEKTGKSFDVTGRLANVLTSRIFRMAASFLLITVALGAITWLYDWIKNLDMFTGRLDQATQNLKALNEVQKDVAQSSGEILGKYRILSDTVKDLSISYEDRLRAANELKKLFPEELEHSSAQAIANGKEKDSLDALSDSVVKLAKAKAAATEIEKQEGQIIELQIQRDKVNSAKAQETLRASRGNPSALDASIENSSFGSGTETTESLKKKGLAAIKGRADVANADIAAQIAIKENTIKMLEQYGGLQNEAEVIEGKPKKGPKGPKDNTWEIDAANAKAQLEYQKALAKEGLDNDQNTYEARLTFLRTYIEKSNALIDLERDSKNKKPGITKTGKNTNNTEAETQRLGVTAFDKTETERLAKERNDALRKNLEDLLKSEESAAAEALRVQQELTDGQLQILDEQKNKEETVLAEKYKKGIIDEKAYRAELKKIADQYNVDRLGAIAFQEQSKLEILQAEENNKVNDLKSTGATDDSQSVKDVRNNSGVSQQKKVVSSAGIKLQDALNQQTQDDNKPINPAKEKVGWQDYADQALKALDVVQQAMQQAADAKIAALEKEAKYIDYNASLEKTRIGNSILSSKEKAREQAIIDAQAHQQQLAIAAQEAKIKRDAAKFDKAANIAKAVEGTAVGIVNALTLPPPGGEILAGIIGAIGLAQIAVIASQPLPAFAKGGTVAKDGHIITGEVGTELRIDPSGSMSLTADRANVTYAKAGTKIISNKELMNIVGKPEPVYYVNDTRIEMHKLEKLTSETNELLRKQKRPIVNIHADRFGDYSRQRNY